MYAYIYIKSKNKYLTVKDSEIEEFHYETRGPQSKKISSKPFKYIGPDKKSMDICQILIVASTSKEIKKLLAKKRPPVPKLNISDLQISKVDNITTVQMEETTRIKNTRSNFKKAMGNAKTIQNDQIIHSHLLNFSTSTMNDANKPSTVTKVNTEHDNNNEYSDTHENDVYSNDGNDDNGDNDDNDSNDGNDGNDKDTNDNTDSDSDQLSSIEENINHDSEDNASDTERRRTNNNHADDNDAVVSDEDQHNERDPDEYNKIMAENRKLKEKLIHARRLKNVALRCTKKLQNKCKNYEHIIQQKNTDSGALNQKVRPKGMPLPICTQSGIMVRADALEDFYSKLKPSMFYEHMCYIVWDQKELAKRCIKINKKTAANIKILTPKKLRAIRKHFIHYLRYFRYHSVLFNAELLNINKYAHRAITCAQRFVKMIEENPEVDYEGAINDRDYEKVEI